MLSATNLMDSPKTVSRYAARNSKKRVFPAGSSSVEVSELPPPMNRTSKSKRTEVIPHEIIDLDAEEDYGGIIHIDEDINESGRGKCKDPMSLASSQFGGTQPASLNLKAKRSSKLLEADLKRSTTSSGKAYPENEPSLSLKKSKKERVYSSTHEQSPSSSNPTLGMPCVGPVVSGSASALLGKDSSVRVHQRNVDEILQKFDLFKKFDTVEEYSDHHYSKGGFCSKQPPKNWAKRIQKEWKILEKDLPDMIFVRVYESRMDLLRAVIIGAEGTPYHDGLFFFDVFFPSTYPNVPPKVHYHSGGLGINPNLYGCGKVCLSLLNTWSGNSKEKWVPRVSTMLQVLVSIQGLILNAKPYFNEPEYESSRGSKSGEKQSLRYNESTLMLSLRTMVYNMRTPPKHFEAFVVRHFRTHARAIMVSCEAYLQGVQVGCLVKGGVQDVDESDNSCSKYFRTDLARFITTLIDTFSQIGAKECQEFQYLSQKVNR